MKLYYHVKNGGDGSANVKFHSTLEAAQKADEAQLEGWGESSADNVELKLEDGKLFYRSYELISGNEARLDYKYDWVWVEVKE